MAFHLRTAALFYAGILGAALLWGWLRGDVNVFVLPPGDPVAPELHWRVGLGVGGGLLFVATARVFARFAWAQRLEAEFRRLLGPLRLRHVTVLALLSAVAEEAFFRGAMQPTLGLVPTSLVFGLMHIGPGRAFWPWTATALAAGFALGGITELTGDLLAAILAHFTVNYFHLWRISGTD